MKRIIIIVSCLILFIACSEEHEEIDNSKYQLVGTVWTSYVRNDNGLDIYDALNFHQSTVSKYSSNAKGEKYDWSTSNDFAYSINDSEVVITEFGTDHAGTRSGDILNIFDRQYKKQ